MNWISVDERLPETSHDDLLIINEMGWKRIARFLDSIKHGKTFFDHNDNPIKNFNATHWMLIEYPKAGDKNPQPPTDKG